MLTALVMLISAAGLVAILILICFLNLPAVGEFNASLSNISNISAFLAMVFTLVALFISAWALRLAVQKPDLDIKITFYDGANIDDLKLIVHRTSRQILQHDLTNLWRPLVQNHGKASARNVTVTMTLENATLKETDISWHKIDNPTQKNQHTTYLMPEEYGQTPYVIHPGFPKYIRVIDFRGRHLDFSDVAPQYVNLSFALAADGYTPSKRIKKLARIEYDAINYELEDWLLSKNISGMSQPNAEKLVISYKGVVPPTYEALSALPFAEEGLWCNIFLLWKNTGIVK